MTTFSEALKELAVTEYTEAVGPEEDMVGPLADGGTLIAHTAPGCWGPMITPEMKDGHEVTRQVAIAGAEIGDAVAIAIRRIDIRSRATSSGTDAPVAGRNLGDPYLTAICPGCGTVNPTSYVKGIGPQAIRCQVCDSEIIPFFSPQGYTMVFSEDGSLGVTVDRRAAEEIAHHHAEYSGLWEGSRQHSVLVMALSDLPGILTRVRPMIGNIGTAPGVRLPASKNAGDFGQSLIGASHDMAVTWAELDLRTDGHMDIDAVGEGTIVVAPVRVPGAGVYIGDVHAMQGDGEIAGHTTDVAAEVTMQVNLLKGCDIAGPVLLPRMEDLPPLSRPYTAIEVQKGTELAQTLGVQLQGAVAPVQVVGSGADLNQAVDNGLRRLAHLASMSLDEIRNRVTITGGIEIGRLPGLVQVTALLPMKRLDQLGLGDLYRKQYGLD